MERSGARFGRKKPEAGREKNFPMIETAPGASTPVTPLALLLASSARAHELNDYRGAMTPRELDASERETAALVESAAVHDLGWMKRVAVRGEDKFRWLSGMVTNMVNELGENTGAWNLVLNAQGRIQGDLTVWREKDSLELEIAADQYERLMAHLEHFIIMDDVELVPLNGDAAGRASAEATLGLTGPRAGEALGRAGLPELAVPMTSTRVEWYGFDLLVTRGYGALGAHYALSVPLAGLEKLWKFLLTAGATPVGSARVEAFRIAEGIPLYGVDMAEKDLPQETSQTRALHFNKGCYLGQEIVERIRSRGNVHRHLRQLELFGPAPARGTELTLDGGAAAGRITSAAGLALAAGSRVYGLGLIRAEAEVGWQTFHYSDGTNAGTARIAGS
jgi:folate-binding protein YgfZ